MDIKVLHMDNHTIVKVDDVDLPDIFSGYEIKSSDRGGTELCLVVRGNINKAELDVDRAGNENAIQQAQQALRAAFSEGLRRDEPILIRLGIPEQC